MVSIMVRTAAEPIRSGHLMTSRSVQ